MPTYDYVCRKCEHRFEQYQSMTEPKLVKCPQCGREALERLIGAGAGILFKGSGFYETDYKRPAAARPEAPATPAAPGTAAPGTAATDKAAPDKQARPDKPAAGGPATDKSAGSKPSAPSKPPGPSKGPAKPD
jgi:putative FmdB family regulatory protein